MKYLIYDAETETHELYERKASPWNPLNWMVAEAWKTNDTEVEHNYFGKNRSYGTLGTLLKKYKPDFVVGHNIKFDLLWNLQDPENYKAWKEYVANGGLIWDTQLAQYLISGQSGEFFYNSLNDLAVLYGGTQKVDAIAMLWAQGVQTSDIDKDLLLEYLCGKKGAGLGDIGNTELVFLQQYEKVKERGQMGSVLVNMGALIASVEMELNGMYVDKALAYKQLEELNKERLDCFATMKSLLPKDLPFEFNWGSRHHLSALIFGGIVKYKERDTVFDDEGKPVVYKTGKKKGEVKTSLQEKFYKFSPMATPLPEWKNANGTYSTKGEILDELTDSTPLLAALRKFSLLNRNIDTYYYNGDPDKPKGMLLKVGVDSIIHHSLNHTSTVTGRLSSSNPNLQNISKGDKAPIKQCFKSRFDGGSIVQSDFTSLEIYVQANESHDETLIDELNRGLDMHCARVALKNHISYEEAYDLCKVKEDPKWKKERSRCKTFSFQRAYGAGAEKVSKSTGLSIQEVKDLIAAEEKKYPNLTKYFEDVMIKVKQSRKPSKNWGFHSQIRSMKLNFGVGYYRSRTGKLYSYTETEEPKAIALKDGVGTSFSPTIVKNYSVQGEGAEQIKAAMWLAVVAFYSEGTDHMKLVNQVHDAIYLDVDKGYEAQSAELLQRCMVGSNKFIEDWFGIEIYAPVPTETVCGSSMAEENHIVIGERYSSFISEISTKLCNRYKEIK